MSLNYDEIYVLTCSTGNFFPADMRMIALGAKEVPPPAGRSDRSFQFLTNDGAGGHQLHGEIVLDDLETRVVEIRDQYQTGIMGEEVRWKFEPLTLKLFDEMAGSIQGYAEMRSYFATTADLKVFYRALYLDEELES